MTKRLVIFDMDGTLTDSSRVIANAINFVRKRLGLSAMDPERIVPKINDPQLNAAEYFYETERFEPRHEAWFAEYYSAHHQKELQLYDGIVALLKWLRGEGCLLAVATNAYRRSTIETLKHLKILEYFDAVASYDDVPRGKPAPDMLWRILERLDCVPDEALFVGDGERDRMAAEAAGIEFVLVEWGFSEHENAVKNPKELQALLARRCAITKEGGV